MKNLKTVMLFVLAGFFAISAKAQSVDEGKAFLYYERYQSAKDVFDKVLSSKPTDEAAIYYLGQAYIGLEKVQEAKNLYLQKMAQMPNSPLILAGVGHIELLEGKTADARQHFETAISLSKGKDVDVLNAVGFANSNYESKKGDAAYAVDVLTRATETKRFKDPAVMVNLGDAYRKLGDGGKAVSAYEKALDYDPNYARASFRIGRVYQTQGRGQEPLYLAKYNEAIGKDAKYAPVYSTLFNYYYETDVPKSATYLDKLLANTDPGPQSCHVRASIKYAQGLFQEAITQADQCIAEGGTDVYAKLYQLKAFSYKRLNDTANASKNFNQYFATQNPEKIEGGDYAAYAGLLVNYPNNEAKVAEYTNRAVMMDTLQANKVSYIQQVAKAYDEKQNYEQAAKWYSRLLNVKKNFSNVDIFNAGYNYYAANKMDSSNKYFTLYTEKYPDDIMGYYMLGNASAIIDSTGELGMAVPYYQKTIDIALADTSKPQAKNRLINAYKFFIGYYANTIHDNAKALEYVDRGLAIMPGDETLMSYREILSKAPQTAPTQQPKRTSTNSTGSTPAKAAADSTPAAKAKVQ